MQIEVLAAVAAKVLCVARRETDACVILELALPACARQRRERAARVVERNEEVGIQSWVDAGVPVVRDHERDALQHHRLDSRVAQDDERVGTLFSRNWLRYHVA